MWLDMELYGFFVVAYRSNSPLRLPQLYKFTGASLRCKIQKLAETNNVSTLSLTILSTILVPIFANWNIQRHI